MIGYQAIYRCRLCGEVYKNVFTRHRDLALETVRCACIKSPSEVPIMIPTINKVHDCADGSVGVADFIGFKQVYHMEA